MVFRLTALSLLSGLALVACDSGSTPGGATDAADTTVEGDTTATPDGADTSGPGPDTTTPPDTNTPGPDTVVSGCDKNSFTFAQQTFENRSGLAVFTGYSATSEPVTGLAIELYSSGNYTGATTTGSYDLAGHDYASCSNCVVIRADCAGGTCAKTFFADEGSLVITEWGGPGGSFKAQLVGVKAKEVVINPQTFASTPVVGGQTWCLDGLTVEAGIKSIPISDRTQPECVANGTGVYVNDNVGNFMLYNCNGDRVKLHDDCGSTEKKALWIVATAGWCTACSQFLAEMVSNHGGSLSRAKVAQQTPGLDMLIVLGENAQGAKPSQAYCKTYAEQKKLDPAMVVIDWSDAGVPIPLIDPEGYAIETNSLATVWSKINPYLVEEGGSVTSAYPWWALLRPYNMQYIWSDYVGTSSFEQALGTLLAE